MENVSKFLRNVQLNLIPAAEAALGELPKKHQRLLAILEMTEMESFCPPVKPCRGRPQHSRARLARAFVGKAFFNLLTTRSLIERLEVDCLFRAICGWNTFERLPDESTFSRAFTEFALSRLPQAAHERLISEYANEVGTALFVSRDSTKICGWEPAEPKIVKEKLKGRGRPKGKGRMPKPPSRLERQRRMTSIEEMIGDLPSACNYGCKRNSEGNTEKWKGYKYHIDVADGQIPISCILTSASVHDSQVALPLMALTDSRLERKFEVMDAAYDAWEIYESAYDRDIIPVIAQNRRGSGEIIEKVSVPQRSEVERVNGRLKEEFGGRFVRVRGAQKVDAHLMFGIIALTADQLMRLG